MSQRKVAIAIFINSLAPLNSAANPVIYCIFSSNIGANLRSVWVYWILKCYHFCLFFKKKYFQENSALTLEALKYCCVNNGDRRVFHIEIIINVLVSAFRFTWIPMLWVYAIINMFTLTVRGSTLDVRIWRLKTWFWRLKLIPALLTDVRKFDPRTVRVKFVRLFFCWDTRDFYPLEVVGRVSPSLSSCK